MLLNPSAFRWDALFPSSPAQEPGCLKVPAYSFQTTLLKSLSRSGNLQLAIRIASFYYLTIDFYKVAFNITHLPRAPRFKNSKSNQPHHLTPHHLFPRCCSFTLSPPIALQQKTTEYSTGIYIAKNLPSPLLYLPVNVCVISMPRSRISMPSAKLPPKLQPPDTVQFPIHTTNDSECHHTHSPYTANIYFPTHPPLPPSSVAFAKHDQVVPPTGDIAVVQSASCYGCIPAP